MGVFFIKPEEGFKVLKNLTFLSQFGLSLVLPMVLFVLGSVWLRERLGLGSWVTLVAILLGIGTWVPTVSSFARYMLAEAKKSEDGKKL